MSTDARILVLLVKTGLGLHHTDAAVFMPLFAKHFVQKQTA